MGTVGRKIRKLKYALDEVVEGLCPEREEPTAPEEGLEYQIDFLELLGRAMTNGEIICVPREVKAYADRVWLSFSCGTEEDLEPTECTCPRTSGERSVSFEALGKTFQWDIRDQVLRFAPEFDPAVRAELNPWVAIMDSRVLRVEREYALHNLSEACLAYAFCDNGDSFDWCIQDYSAMPVVFELNPLFWRAFDVLSETILSPHVQDMYSHLGMYTPFYCEAAGITTDNFIEICRAQKKRELWEPETV